MTLEQARKLKVGDRIVLTDRHFNEFAGAITEVMATACAVAWDDEITTVMPFDHHMDRVELEPCDPCHGPEDTTCPSCGLGRKWGAG